MRALISIIVPVYNVENYVSDCINSVLKQSFTNFELILIDDGSTDNSGEICNRFAEKDPRIKVVHVKNGGVSSARNIGVTTASGEWLLFLDGDDLLESDALNIINHNIQNYKDVEMIIGSFQYVYSTNKVSEKNVEFCKKGTEVVKDYGLWNIKIRMGSFTVKKDVINRENLTFDENTKYGEDVEFINYCLLNSLKVRGIKDTLMNYIIHHQSSIARVSFDRYDCYKARKRTLVYIQQKYPNHKEVEMLYKCYLLPQAIIDTTNLLCRESISFFKIKRYLNNQNYYSILHSVKDDDNTPPEMRKEITDFLKSPILYWSRYSLLSKYYALRQNIGLAKRSLMK